MEESDNHKMEDDRAQVGLGTAVNVEEMEEEVAVLRKPKKRFVGRRQAAEAASKTDTNGNVESSGSIQGNKHISFLYICS